MGLSIDVFDMDKLISVNQLREVTNPIMIERDNIPTRDGLLSTDIFGRTVDDRQNVWAYISLNEKFFNPYLYKVLKRIYKFDEIIAGHLYVSITPQGEIVEDENGETGLPFLVKNFEKIRFKKNESQIRKERIDLISSVRHNELFLDKWIVCPPFYRDIQMGKADKGKVSYHVINTLYSRLMRLAKSLQEDSGLPIVSNMTRLKIQNTLIEIYDFYTGDIKGKNGIFRQFVLGKSIDYGVRTVISSPLFNGKKYTENLVDFYHCGLPLSMACVLFYPYILKRVKDFFYDELYMRRDNFPIRYKGEPMTVRLTNTDLFSDDYITKQIDSFIHSYGDRFKTIDLENDKNIPVKLKFYGSYADNRQTSVDGRSSSIIDRPMTWTDILYMAAVQICEEGDMHVLITRYPLEDYFGTFPNKVRILTTLETQPMILNGKLYKYYPKIDVNLSPEKVSNMFIDTLKISNLYLNGIGGDYDGD